MDGLEQEEVAEAVTVVSPWTLKRPAELVIPPPTKNPLLGPMTSPRNDQSIGGWVPQTSAGGVPEKRTGAPPPEGYAPALPHGQWHDNRHPWCMPAGHVPPMDLEELQAVAERQLLNLPVLYLDWAMPTRVLGLRIVSYYLPLELLEELRRHPEVGTDSDLLPRLLKS